MKRIYIITGANGHLGSTLVRMLEKQDCLVRGLILPQEHATDHGNVTYYKGDVRKRETLLPLFADTQGAQVIVLHTAGIINIAKKASPTIYDVNVNGTKTVAALCLEKKVKRMVYVSSVHAIPEKAKPLVLKEVYSFSPQQVTGGYAKTKAEATRLLLEEIKHGLDAVVVHPSGILGPYDAHCNHLVQLVSDYICGRLPACVNGGYDFVDVRDVAQGCLLAADKGKKGECYILSNRHYEIKELLKMVRSICGGRRLPVLPIWLAKAAVPFIQLHAKRTRQRPLYTSYSLYTLQSNDRFSHDKATSELGWRPRDLYQTIADTIAWLKKSQTCKAKLPA